MTSPGGVARELVTKLSFTFNRANLDRFEKSITSFKKSIVTTTGDITSAISKTIDFFSTLTNASIKTRDIAEFAGIATSEFVAMREAAGELGVNTQTFDKFILKLSTDISNAKAGFGDFIDLVRKNSGKISAPNQLNDIDNLRKALSEIFDLVQSIDEKQAKVRFLGNFGLDFDEANDFLRLMDQGKSKFIELTQARKKYGEEVEANAAADREYKKQVDGLSRTFSRYVDNILRSVVPALNQLLEHSRQTVELIENTAEQGGGGVSGFFKNLISAPFELAALYAKDSTKQSATISAQALATPTNQTNNLNVEINVPAGTTQEQALFLADAMRKAVDDVLQQQTREIINNNPQVE